MSQSKAQLIGGVGISTAQSITVGAAVTINSSGVVASGIITSTSFIGNVTGNLTGTASTATAAATAYGLTGSIDGSNVTSLNADNLSSGTVPDARFPATLPSASGANLTSLNASNLGSGTVPDARFPATLPAASGANLTSLNASNLSSGTVATARLASGTANSGTYLRGDQTWAAISSGLTISDDTSTNATRYLTFTSATSGSVSSENVSSSKLTFNPSTGKLTVTGFTASNNAVLPVGNVAARDSTQGSIRYNSEYSRLEFYDGSTWIPIVQADYTSNSSDIAVFGGGIDQSTGKETECITISSTGNSEFFGFLIPSAERINRMSNGNCGNSIKGYFSGGLTSPGTFKGTQVCTFATRGESFNMGQVFRRDVYGHAAFSNSTRGIFAGGYVNNIDYITFSSGAYSEDFGDLLAATVSITGCASPTRGIVGGGRPGGVYTNVIQYVTIASTGNATDFGDLTATRANLASCSSSTRGLFAGGEGPDTNRIDYITIASTGNATDFGDLLNAHQYFAGASNATRGVFAGGNPASNVIQYVTIASTGDATDFGDLSSGYIQLSSASSAHGGLQ